MKTTNEVVLVFTGRLDMRRSDATALATSIGYTVAQGVTKQTTILVVGVQVESRFPDNAKSAKHLKALQLRTSGQGICILNQSDFNELVNQAYNQALQLNLF